MILWLYQGASFILMLAAMSQVGFFSGVALLALSLIAFFPGYNAMGVLLHVASGKLVKFAIQLWICWLVWFLGAWLNLSLTVGDSEVKSEVWVAVGLLIGAWNGFTRAPDADEIADANQPLWDSNVGFTGWLGSELRMDRVPPGSLFWSLLIWLPCMLLVELALLFLVTITFSVTTGERDFDWIMMIANVFVRGPFEVVVTLAACRLRGIGRFYMVACCLVAMAIPLSMIIAALVLSREPSAATRGSLLKPEVRGDGV